MQNLPFRIYGRSYVYVQVISSSSRERGEEDVVRPCLRHSTLALSMLLKSLNYAFPSGD
jgi:hypothetical protein